MEPFIPRNLRSLSEPPIPPPHIFAQNEFGKISTSQLNSIVRSSSVFEAPGDKPEKDMLDILLDENQNPPRPNTHSPIFLPRENYYGQSRESADFLAKKTQQQLLARDNLLERQRYQEYEAQQSHLARKHAQRLAKEQTESLSRQQAKFLAPHQPEYIARHQAQVQHQETHLPESDSEEEPKKPLKKKSTNYFGRDFFSKPTAGFLSLSSPSKKRPPQPVDGKSPDHSTQTIRNTFMGLSQSANSEVRAFGMPDFLALTTSFSWEDFEKSLKGDWSNLSRTIMLKQLIRLHGIPGRLRIHVWPRLNNSYQEYQKNMEPFCGRFDLPTPWRYCQVCDNRLTNFSLLFYSEVVLANVKKENDNTRQIEKDLSRTFPESVWFNSAEIQAKLRSVLSAFSWSHPRIGYCQAMSYWTALLLLFLDEELTFWVMRSITNYLLPNCYFTASMIDILVDTKVFQIMLEELIPRIAIHLQTYNVEVSLVIPKWFLTLYCGALPPETGMRVLDGFLYDGDKILFRVAFALFALNQGPILASKETSLIMQTIMTMPKAITDSKLLMETAYSFTFSRNWISKLRAQVKATENLAPAQQELQDDVLGECVSVKKSSEWGNRQIIDDYDSPEKVRQFKTVGPKSYFSEINAQLIL